MLDHFVLIRASDARKNKSLKRNLRSRKFRNSLAAIFFRCLSSISISINRESPLVYALESRNSCVGDIVAVLGSTRPSGGFQEFHNFLQELGLVDLTVRKLTRTA
ncbi:hypothetical protein PO909_012973 [Leuciscus waleckii]